MIDFEGYYLFPADQVEWVDSGIDMAKDHPYSLVVYLKSGKSFTVRYIDKAVRDRARGFLRNQIDRELRHENKQILNKLYLLHDIVQRIDKRQLRIWRQLKQLLNLPQKIDDEP